VDACRVATDEPIAAHRGTHNPRTAMNDGWQDYSPEERRTARQTAGRWPANVVLVHSPACTSHEQWCAPGCPVAELDRQSGTSKSSGGKGGASGRPGGRGVYGTYDRAPDGGANAGGLGDEGGASRFFPTFRWEPKAPTEERPQISGVSHPTVKPVALMRWLVRLVTPPGGVVLDPFAGTGTTGHAARAEGMGAILIEREPAFLPLIRARLDARPRQAAPPPATAAADDEPMDLLDLLGDAS
jgi:DNA methylase